MNTGEIAYTIKAGRTGEQQLRPVAVQIELTLDGTTTVIVLAPEDAIAFADNIKLAAHEGLALAATHARVQ